MMLDRWQFCWNAHFLNVVTCSIRPIDFVAVVVVGAVGGGGENKQAIV